MQWFVQMQQEVAQHASDLAALKLKAVQVVELAPAHTSHEAPEQSEPCSEDWDALSDVSDLSPPSPPAALLLVDNSLLGGSEVDAVEDASEEAIASPTNGTEPEFGWRANSLYDDDSAQGTPSRSTAACVQCTPAVEACCKRNAMRLDHENT